MIPIIIVLGIVLCIVGSHVFSSSEMSYSSCNPMRIENSEDKRAPKALYILDHFEEALSTILIGNNLVNIACSSLTSVFIIIVSTDRYTWIGTVVVTILVIIFGETIPKIIAKKKPNTLALFYAPFIRILMTLFFPAVWVVVKLTGLLTGKMKEEEADEEEQVEELQSIIETAEDEGILDEDQSEMLQNAIEFDDTSASEVMTARVDMDTIDIDDPLEEIVRTAEETRYSRIPVYEDSIDNIIGTLHLNVFYKGLIEKKTLTRDDLEQMLYPPCYVYKSAKLPEVLDTLKKAKQHLAIVTDEYGGTAGVITMEDVLEEIVGEIWDENDVIEKDAVRVGANEFKIDGDMSIYEFFDFLDLDEDVADEYESETVGGWAIEMLEHYPVEGESFDWECENKKILVTISEVDERRVEKLLIKVYND